MAKKTSFEEFHESITAHFREVVSLVRALQAYPQPGLLDQLFSRNGGVPSEFVRLHAVNSTLASLIKKRREHLPRFLADVRSWDVIRLSTARRKIEFDLAALVLTPQRIIHNPAYSVTTNLRPFADRCSQENRFLNHLLMELDAALDRLQSGAAAKTIAREKEGLPARVQTPDEKLFDEKKAKRYLDVLDGLFEELTLTTTRDIEARKLYKQLRRETYTDAALTADEKDEILDRLESRYRSKTTAAGISVYEEEEE